MFDDVPRILDENVTHRGDYEHDYVYMLENLIRCSVCDGIYTIDHRAGSTGNAKYGYYHHICKDKRNFHLPAEDIDEMVRETTNPKLLPVDDLEQTVNALKEEGHDQKTRQMKTNLESLSVEIDRFQRKIDTAVDGRIETDDKEEWKNLLRAETKDREQRHDLEITRDTLQCQKDERENLTELMKKAPQIVKAILEESKDIDKLSSQDWKELLKRIADI